MRKLRIERLPLLRRWSRVSYCMCLLFDLCVIFFGNTSIYHLVESLRSLWLIFMINIVVMSWFCALANVLYSLPNDTMLYPLFVDIVLPLVVIMVTEMWKTCDWSNLDPKPEVVCYCKVTFHLRQLVLWLCTKGFYINSKLFINFALTQNLTLTSELGFASYRCSSFVLLYRSITDFIL